MTQNVNVVVTASARFIYKIIYEKWAKIESKMAIKCLKRVQISYNLDHIKQINWSIYERGVAISVEKVALEFQCENSVFRPKIGQFSLFFKNFLAIDKTT